MQRTTKTFIGGLVIGLFIGAVLQATLTLNHLETVWLSDGVTEDDIWVSSGVDIRR